VKKILVASFVSLLLSVPVSAFAKTQTITALQARGESGSVPTIKVALNVGVPIKMPTGWRIYKGWLDNNTRAEVDGDRPFEQGATVLFLVGRSSGSGKLSMMVRSPNGDEHLFVMRLVVGSKSSPDFVNVTDSSSRNLSAKTSGQTPVDAIRQGMEIASGQGRLIRGSELWTAIESFNSLVSQGMSSDLASRQAGISLGVIEQLLRLGKDAPATLPVPVPAPPTPKQPNNDDLVTVDPPKMSNKTRLSKQTKSPETKVRQKANSELDISQSQFLAAVPDTQADSEKKSSPVSTHSIANGLVRGLQSPQNRIVKRGSYKYQKLQTVVQLLRQGKSFEEACSEARVKLETAREILAYGGIDLSGLGGLW
jgi:hypothetical protein